MPNKNKNKNKPLKVYLFRIYLIIFVALLFTTTLYNAFVLNKQVIFSREQVSQKINKVIQFNRNEILEELILGDTRALKQHLAILQRELDIDEIALIYKDMKIQAIGNFDSRSPLFLKIEDYFLDLFNIVPQEKNIANDYGNLNVLLKFSYGKSIYRKTVIPLFRQSAFSIAIILLATALVFFLSFIQIQRSIIAPLKQLLKSTSLQKSAIKEIEELQIQIKEYEMLRKKAVALEIGKTVAHDIKSPIFALKMLLTELQDLPEEKRLLLKSAITRIHEIAENLTKSETPEEQAIEGKEVIQLACIIENIVSEKILQLKNTTTTDIEFNKTVEGYGLFSIVEAPVFKRVLSNILNNAIEALYVKGGSVKIYLEEQTDFNVIRIKDNGKGIPSHIIPQLMQKGATFDKEKGTGIGLHHAKEAIESWGGKITITSVVSRSTEVTIFLPKSPKPFWFKPYIWLNPNQEVVVVDDDPLIHRIWEDRLLHTEAPIKLRHFHSGVKFCEWFEKTTIDPSILFLIDYELRGETLSGLDIIKKCGINYKSILVTNRYDDKEVVAECNHLDVRLIPKLLATLVPVKIEQGFTLVEPNSSVYPTDL